MSWLDGLLNKKVDRADDEVVASVQPRFAAHDVKTAFSCLLYTSPSPRDGLLSRMPSSA